MKLHVLLIIWMFITLLLLLSVIGIVLFLPSINATQYYKPLSERRSTWMTIGVNLIEKIIKDDD